MNLTLTRTEFASDGIFGSLADDNAKFRCITLEHAYATDDGTFVPKVAAGVYTCKLHPPNRLPYTTYELQNVPDFQGQPVSGILIHILNFDSESQGCIGVGNKIAAAGDGTREITESRDTFKTLMSLQNNIPEFTLTIKEMK